LLVGASDQPNRYWNAIIENGGSEGQCSWCKDRWGLSWQIVPRAGPCASVTPMVTARRTET
jgi:predicted 3-demethylubiquinone-9 3-methyltransferase (glyoxalase superfamily)